MLKKKRAEVIEAIHDKGMTVNGWARTRGFSKNTVKNVLYRDSVGDEGKVTMAIIEALRKEGLYEGL